MKPKVGRGNTVRTGRRPRPPAEGHSGSLLLYSLDGSQALRDGENHQRGILVPGEDSGLLSIHEGANDFCKVAVRIYDGQLAAASHTTSGNLVVHNCCIFYIGSSSYGEGSRIYPASVNRYRNNSYHSLGTTISCPPLLPPIWYCNNVADTLIDALAVSPGPYITNIPVSQYSLGASGQFSPNFPDFLITQNGHLYLSWIDTYYHSHTVHCAEANPPGCYVSALSVSHRLFYFSINGGKKRRWGGPYGESDPARYTHEGDPGWLYSRIATTGGSAFGTMIDIGEITGDTTIELWLNIEDSAWSTGSYDSLFVKDENNDLPCAETITWIASTDQTILKNGNSGLMVPTV